MKSALLKRSRFFLTGIFIFGAAAGTQAQHLSNSPRFKEWDKDKNHKITHAEFYEGMKKTGVFEAWDKNGDNVLDRQEVYAGKARMQQLADKTISAGGGAGKAQNSLQAQSVQEGGFFPLGNSANEMGFTFREVDLNRDGTLDKTEFFTALFRLWDQEEKGFLRSHELTETQLKQWLLA